MRGVLGHALNRELSRVWLAWRELWTNLWTVRARLVIVAKRLLMKSQLRALNAWVDAHERARHARELLRRSLLRCMRGSLSRCLERWLEHLGERRRLQQVGGRLQHRGLALGWSAWRAAVEEQHAAWRSMQWAAARVLTPALSRAWSSWLAPTCAYCLPPLCARAAACIQSVARPCRGAPPAAPRLGRWARPRRPWPCVAAVDGRTQRATTRAALHAAADEPGSWTRLDDLVRLVRPARRRHLFGAPSGRSTAQPSRWARVEPVALDMSLDI